MDFPAEYSSQNSQQAYGGTLPETVGMPTQRPTTPVVTNSQQARSINLTIVGPAKSYVTKTAKKALNIVKTAKRKLVILDGTNAPNDTALKNADKFLTALKEVKNQIDTLEQYIKIKFEQPAIRFLPEKLKLLSEVLETFVPNEITARRQELAQCVSNLEMWLSLFNFPVTPFVPIPVETLANSHHDDQAEAYEDEPIIESQPTAPYQGMEEQANIDQVQVRPTAKAASITGLPSLNSCGNAQRLHNIEPNKIRESSKRYDAEIERLMNKAKLLELKRDKQFLTTVQQHHDQVTSDYISAQKTKKVVHSANTMVQQAAKPALNNENQILSNNQGLEILSQTLLKINETNVRSANDTHQLLAASHQMIADLPRMFIEQLDAYNNAEGSCKSSRVSRVSRALSTKTKKSGNEGVSVKEEDNKNNTYQPPPQEQQTPHTPIFTTTPAVQVQSHHGSALKLDTLLKILPPYNGNGNLDMFISQFRDAILDNNEISTKQKYLVLANKITGEAKRYLIESENFEEAIEKTFDGLKGSFGKEDTQQNLLDKLYTLPLRQTDVKSMRLDIASHDQVVYRLLEKGFAASDERLYSPLLAKLPPRYRDHMTMFLAKQGEIVYYREVRSEIEVILNSVTRERTLQRYQVHTPVNEIPQQQQALIHVAQASATNPPNNKGVAPAIRPLAYNPNNHPKEFHDQITNTTLPGYYAPGTGGPSLALLPRSFPYENEEPNTCKVCSGKHSDIRCPLTSTEFRKLLNSKSLCPICAQKHTIETCRAVFKCGYCSGTHHMGSCPQKEHYRNKANYPAGAKKIFKFFRAPTKH